LRLVLSRSSVPRFLKAKGWRRVRPRLAPARQRDLAATAKRAAMAQAQQVVATGQGRVLYLDECDPHLLPVIRALWMKGPRLRIPMPGTNAKQACFGALAAATGRWHWVDHPRTLAVQLVAFLDHLAAHYPTGPLYLALDSVSTHTAKAAPRWLAAYPRGQVRWLPNYGAHAANPVLRTWGLLNRGLAANRLAGSRAWSRLLIVSSTTSPAIRPPCHSLAQERGPFGQGDTVACFNA
jgi:hypothetical protein